MTRRPVQQAREEETFGDLALMMLGSVGFALIVLVVLEYVISNPWMLFVFLPLPLLLVAGWLDDRIAERGAERRFRQARRITDRRLITDWPERETYTWDPIRSKPVDIIVLAVSTIGFSLLMAAVAAGLFLMAVAK